MIQTFSLTCNSTADEGTSSRTATSVIFIPGPWGADPIGVGPWFTDEVTFLVGSLSITFVLTEWWCEWETERDLESKWRKENSVDEEDATEDDDDDEDEDDEDNGFLDNLWGNIDSLPKTGAGFLKILLTFEDDTILDDLVLDCCCSAALIRFSNNDFNEGDSEFILGAKVAVDDDDLFVWSFPDDPLAADNVNMIKTVNQ